ncbi:pilin [Moraxella bovis]|nr:pilin [Moraxella bovis]UYZ88114.1 pilin [Moraxella bovis]UYZ99142.1 pilin [Moraxella bovis]UZA20753.1 pilin [Moraxella bovis]UZA23495.1 pilin [Moraxella bovis]
MTFIGILAAIALPAYQDYISKSQMTRVVGELAAGKTAVDAALFEGKEPIIDGDSSSTQENIGLKADGNPRSNLMEAVNINGFKDSGAGSISATLGNKANKDIKGTVATQSRDAQGVWSCSITKGGNYKVKFNPTGCTGGN